MKDTRITLPDGSKIKQFAIGRGADDIPFFAFLSEKGSVFVECDQGWPRIGKLNAIQLRDDT